MNRDNTSRIIALVALLIAVIGVTIGFSVASKDLKISSSAEVTPDLTKFDVNFSSSNTEEIDGEVVATPSVATISGDNATINNELTVPTISGLKANFTEPGQSVTYTFYAHNAGKYVAYLKAIAFENVTGQSLPKVCTGKTGTTESLVTQACSSIKLAVKVGTESYETSKTGIKTHALAIDGYEPVEVTISYESNGQVADGDFTVTFGDISLQYSSVD